MLGQQLKENNFPEIIKVHHRLQHYLSSVRVVAKGLPINYETKVPREDPAQTIFM